MIKNVAALFKILVSIAFVLSVIFLTVEFQELKYLFMFYGSGGTFILYLVLLMLDVMAFGFIFVIIDIRDVLYEIKNEISGVDKGGENNPPAFLPLDSEGNSQASASPR